jgi:hypothetical protein
MRFDGHDFTIVGVALGTAGAILLAKAYLMPSFPAESAMSFYNSNPFQGRNAITTRHEAIAGCAWLLIGLLVSLVGIVRSAHGRQGYLVSAPFDIIVLLAALIVLGRLTVATTDSTSRREYVPILAGMMREAFETHAFQAVHGGLKKAEVAKGLVLPAADAARRVKESSEILDRIGKLFDEPRQDSESNELMVRRLLPYFPGVTVN